MRTLAHSIIGEYFDDGFVEALIDRPNLAGPSLRICVRVQDRADLAKAVDQADVILPSLIADMALAETMATKAIESSVPAMVVDIWIDGSGSSSYTCGFLEGEAEDALVNIQRSRCGEMILD